MSEGDLWVSASAGNLLRDTACSHVGPRSLTAIPCMVNCTNMSAVASHRAREHPIISKHTQPRACRLVSDVSWFSFLVDHPFFVGVQYHPEFLSRPIKPSPPYFGLLLASAGRLAHYLQKGCRLSPRWVGGQQQASRGAAQLPMG